MVIHFHLSRLILCSLFWGIRAKIARYFSDMVEYPTDGNDTFVHWCSYPGILSEHRLRGYGCLSCIDLASGKHQDALDGIVKRSEERRVGKEYSFGC